MSPEQVREKGADPRSDIFALRPILYEMLSGKRAFHGDSLADTMSAILKEYPPNLTPADPAGAQSIPVIKFSADRKSYAYSTPCCRTLYVVGGLK